MAGNEVIDDGVMVYASSLPETAQSLIRNVIEKHPEMNPDEAMTEALHRLTELADYALRDIAPEGVTT